MNVHGKLLAVLAIGAVSAVAISVHHRVTVEEPELRASWQAWEQRMLSIGCKRTGFTTDGRGQVYPVWTCPDGVAHLGRRLK